MDLVKQSSAGRGYICCFLSWLAGKRPKRSRDDAAANRRRGSSNSTFESLSRSVTPSRPSTSSVSVCSVHTPAFLSAVNETWPLAFEPLAEKLKVACPASPEILIEP